MSHLTEIVDSSFSVRLTMALLHCLWQGCLCGLLLIAGDTLLRKRSARLRYHWNWGCLILLVVCLPVTFSLVTVSDAVNEVRKNVAAAEQLNKTRSGSDERAQQQRRDGSNLAPSQWEVDGGRAGEPAVAAERSWAANRDAFERANVDVSHSGPDWATLSFRRFSLWITTIYIAGIMVVFARLMWGTWGGYRLRQTAQVIQDPELLTTFEALAQRIKLRVLPKVAWCGEISVPVVVGVLMPMILLPVATVSGLTSTQLEALLLHEMAHLRRFDPFWNLLQRVIEAVFFFHPVVWWISRRISIEREHAADDMVLAQGWERPRYADALLRVAELSSSRGSESLACNPTMLSAAGTSPTEFKLRLLRVLDVAPPVELSPSRSAILVTLLMAASGGYVISSQPPKRLIPLEAGLSSLLTEVEPSSQEDDLKPDRSRAVQPDPEKNGVSQGSLDELRLPDWSEPVNGLQLRVIPVLSSMNEEAIDPTQPVAAFRNPDEVAFVVETRNCSLETVMILDTRYGPSYGTAHGKPNSDWFSQFLFSIDLYDAKGGLIERPDVQIVDQDLVLSGALQVPLPPEKIHRFLLRPAKWLSPLAAPFEPGTNRVIVRYHGMPDRVAKRIKEYRPHSEPADAWGGDVASHQIQFEVAAPSQTKKSGELKSSPSDEAAADGQGLAWGEPSNGLRAAVSLHPPQSSYAHGDSVTLKFHVQNWSDHSVTFTSPLWLSSLPVSVTNQRGEAISIQGITRLGHTLTARTTLKPGIAVAFDAAKLGLALTSGRAKSLQDTSNWMIGPAGDYALQLGPQFSNGFLLKDGNGKILAPLEGDWTGELKSGEIPLKVVNETIYCNIVDAVTGELISDTTTDIRFIKPKSDVSDEEMVGHIIVARSNTGRIPFVIPDSILGRADREELELQWVVGNHPGYERFSLAERLPLKHFFQSDSKSLQDILGTIKLTPTMQIARLEPKVPTPIERLPDHLNVMALKYDPKSHELVSVSTEADVAVRRWDVETCQLKLEVKLASERHGNRFLFGQLSLSEDCQRLMTISDGNVEIWDTSTGQKIDSLLLLPEMHFRQVNSGAGTPDLSIIAAGLMPGSGFATAEADAYAVIWDVETGHFLRMITHPKGFDMKSVALSPNGEWLATGSQSAGTCLWKVRTGELLRVIPNENLEQRHPDPQVTMAGASQVLCLGFSPDGTQLAIGDLLGVKLIDAESGRMLHQLNVPYRYGRSDLVFSRDGARLARVGTDKAVPIWSTRSGELLSQLPVSSNCGTFAADGLSFAVGMTDEKNGIAVWSLETDAVSTED